MTTTLISSATREVRIGFERTSVNKPLTTARSVFVFAALVGVLGLFLGDRNLKNFVFRGAYKTP